MTLFEQLAAPFRPDQVSWRPGSVTRDKTKAMALAFIDARDVMARLDEVCGPENWERRHPHVDKTTTCEIAIWIEGRGWVVKSDGAGDTAVEAEKGSLSDAFKRAAVNWGIGRYLYDLPSPWVAIDEHKRIKPEELTRLEGLLTAKGAPARTPPAKTETKAPATTATLADRATRLEVALKAAKTADDLRKTYSLASGLCADLDMKDPERLAEIEKVYADRFAALSDTDFAKTPELA